MNIFDAWDKFMLTGKVTDYLNYKKLDSIKRDDTDRENFSDLGDDREIADHYRRKCS